MEDILSLDELDESSVDRAFAEICFANASFRGDGSHCTGTATSMYSTSDEVIRGLLNKIDEAYAKAYSVSR